MNTKFLDKFRKITLTKMCYPVGFYFQTLSTSSPEQIFGHGKWKLIGTDGYVYCWERIA